MKKILALLVFCLAWSGTAAANDEAHQPQELDSDQFGTVRFPTSCTESVQKSFERGVALLHSFWYGEAQKQFQQVATEDPHCAMAHWGIAMSYWHQLGNPPDKAILQRGRAEVRLARALHSRDDRDWGYITAIDAFYGGKKQREYHARAVAYSKAMEVAYRHHPEDREAGTFYALSLLASAPHDDTSFSNQRKAAAILEMLFAQEPDNPGVAHYLIHSYDTPQMAHLGLPAAQRYPKIAPASPHALHMPSDIFARLGLWQDDIAANLASIAAIHQAAALHMGGEGQEFLAMDFLEDADLQSGREADALHLIEEVKAMPATKDTYGLGFNPRVRALVRFPARYALELHRWGDAATLDAVAEANPDDSAGTYWARAIGHARTGQLDEARQDLAALESIHRSLVREKKTRSAELVEHDRGEAAAWLAHAEGRNDEALTTLRKIAETQEAEGERPLAIPAREMLADMLFELNRPQEALTEYQADLKFNPDRFDGLYGAAQGAELAGKSEEANSYYAELLKICAGSGSERPELRHAKQILAQK
jgi:tetratricopeptide (TPR) repeat protein